MFNVRIIFALLFFSILFEQSLGLDISSIKGLSFKNLALLLMIMVILDRKNKNSKHAMPHKFTITAPIVLFIFYCFCSLVFYIILNPSLYGSFRSEIIFFKSYMDPFIISILIYHSLNSKKSIQSILFYFFLLFFIYNLIAVFGSFGIIGLSEVSVDAAKGSARTSWSSPNQFAAYAAFLMPFCLSAFYKSRRLTKKIFFSICFLSGFLNILWSFSRGGLVSLFIGIISFHILNSEKLKFASIVKFYIGLICFFVLFTGLYSILPETTKSGIEINTLGRAQSQELNDFSSGRVGIWERAIRLFLENPFFGTGWKTFTKLVGVNSHNDFLLILVTTGLVGLLLYLFIFYRLLISAIKYRKKTIEFRWYFNAYIAGLLSFLSSMNFSNMINPLLHFFIFSAVIMKLGDLAINDSKGNGSKSAPNTFSAL